MNRLERSRMPANPAREDRHGWKNAAAGRQHETGPPPKLDELDCRAVAGVLIFRCRPDQAAEEQKVDARLQVREVWNRDEQLTAALQDPKQLGECARLFFEGQ